MKQQAPLPFTEVRNATALPESPLLSVLVPYFHDNPAQLIQVLDKQADRQVELVLYDDGSQDSDLSQQVHAAAKDSSMACRVLTAKENVGRSQARNRLMQAAQGQYLLFLDADMLPGEPDFLSTYLNQIKTHGDAIVFGGFSVSEQADTHQYDLHRALSAGSDCLNAKERALVPAKHVCSSNLLVRRDVFEVCPFDPEFVGWGWEDVEWAARADEQFSITHIDNPALHLGLESADTLVRRFRDSAANYARFVHRHPDLARQLPSYRTAKLAGRIPGFKLVRPIFSAIARDPWHLVPMRLRVLALKLWRAGWYAEKLV
jgi:glycosyltransferase involved in cell wall biosynthesis